MKVNYMENFYIEPLLNITIGISYNNINVPELVVTYKGAIFSIMFADSLEELNQKMSKIIDEIPKIPFDKKYIHNENNQLLELLKWFSKK